MLPVEIMMSVFMVSGAIGNTCVLFVYSNRRQKTSANKFIMFLAVIDLFACVVIHPYIIYKLMNTFDQTWAFACKVFEFFVHCNLAISGLTLMLVAIDRFLAICRPVKFLTFDKHVVKAILIITAISVAGSLPLFEFYGPAPSTFTAFNESFIGFKCHYKEEYQNSISLMAFSTFVLCCFLTEIIAMVILYKHVAITAYRSQRNVVPLSNAHILAGITSTNTTLDPTQTSVLSQGRESSVHMTSSNSGVAKIQLPPKSRRTYKTPSLNVTSLFLVDQSTQSVSHSEIELKNRPASTSFTNNTMTINNGNQFSTRLKAAKVLFLVTAVFFMSWMPFFIMRICHTVNSLYWLDQSTTRHVIETMLNHVFYLNNAANPIIYTMINKNFRRDCKILFRKHCRRR